MTNEEEELISRMIDALWSAGDLKRNGRALTTVRKASRHASFWSHDDVTIQEWVRTAWRQARFIYRKDHKLDHDVEVGALAAWIAGYAGNNVPLLIAEIQT